MFLNSRYVALVATLIILLFTTSCKSKFEKLRASNNLQMKYQEAVKYYERGKYSKAQTLFTDLMIKYRGTSDAEDLYYFTAYTSYRLKDYTSARYHFKQYAVTFPNSPRAEECRFMSAYCFYIDSPRPHLDQENTKKAIDELQLFVNLYPQSERGQEAGDLIQKLRDKLEKKAFENAKLYFNMGLPDDYRAAVIALENVLKTYPDTKYAEEAEYLIVKSQYLFADNSYLNRQQSRFNEAIDYYESFVDNYPDSKYRGELDGIRASAEKKIAFAANRINEIDKLRKQQSDLDAQIKEEEDSKKAQTN